MEFHVSMCTAWKRFLGHGPCVCTTDILMIFTPQWAKKRGGGNLKYLIPLIPLLCELFDQNSVKIYSKRFSCCRGGYLHTLNVQNVSFSKRRNHVHFKLRQEKTIWNTSCISALQQGAWGGSWGRVGALWYFYQLEA